MFSTTSQYSRCDANAWPFVVVVGVDGIVPPTSSAGWAILARHGDVLCRRGLGKSNYKAA